MTAQTFVSHFKTTYLWALTIFVFGVFLFSLPVLAQSDCRYDSFSDPTPWNAPQKAEWSMTNDGRRSGTVNMYAHGTLEQLKAALLTAGYVEARPTTVA